MTADVLDESIQLLRKYKKLGEGAMAQVSDDELLHRLDEEGNGIAHIVKHLNGNMRSRWTDFLTTDGEKPDRDRRAEFELAEGIARETVYAWWEEGWAVVFAAVEPLDHPDLARSVTIRGEPLSVMQAILRQLTHYAYHVGQIVHLAKHFRASGWQTLSHPKQV